MLFFILFGGNLSIFIRKETTIPPRGKLEAPWDKLSILIQNLFSTFYTSLHLGCRGITSQGWILQGISMINNFLSAGEGTSLASLELAGRTITFCGLPYCFTGNDPCGTRMGILEGGLSSHLWVFLDDFPEFFDLSIINFYVLPMRNQMIMI